MSMKATSRHLRTASELMVLAPVKAGFVPGTEQLVSYATRLRVLLAGLFEPLRTGAEKTLIATANPINNLRTIYAVQYSVVERPQNALLILSVTFDSSWESYLHNLVDNVGALLDLIFFHCEGYEGHSCSEGYEAFAGWIQKYQVQCELFDAATPDLTVDDLRSLRKLIPTAARGTPIVLRSVVDDAKAALAKAIERAKEEGVLDHLMRERTQELTRMLDGILELREYFPDGAAGPNQSSDQARFDDAMVQFLPFYLAKDIDDPRAFSRDAQQWLKALEPRLGVPNAPNPKSVVLDEATLREIQGNLLEPYATATHGRVLLIQCDDRRAVARLFSRLEGRISTAADGADGALHVNMGLTFEGLKRMRLAHGILSLFPKEFRDGMEQRAGLLGDVGPSHPDSWERLPANGPPGRAGERIYLSSVDVVLIAHGEQGECAKFVQELASMAGDGIHVLHVQALEHQDHFRIADGQFSSQPVPDAVVGGRSLRDRAARRDVVPLGEVLLGYEDRRGEIARCADEDVNGHRARLFKNGTFMVLRKLRQDVPGFEDYVAARSKELEVDPEGGRVRGWLVGRDPSGLALAAPSDDRNNNDFDYSEEGGARCPLHAHVRRANPRDDSQGKVPRIVRRSLSYGAKYTKETSAQDRGLMFMAYNANIAQQFEVIQRWINGGNITGLLSAQNDLLTGVPQVPGVSRWIDHNGPKALNSPPQPFVSLRWGLYLFVPSLGAVAHLAERLAEPSASEPGSRTAGVELMKELDAIKDETLARLAWKEILEEPLRVDSAADVWNAIRASGTPKRTPYGLLIASLADAAAVLGDSGTKYSVREYWARLKATMGEHYLGLDLQVGHRDAGATEGDAAYEQRLGEITYADLATIPNDYIRTQIHPTAAYEAAFEGARGLLNGARAGEGAIDVRDLAQLVVGRLAKEWIGIPASRSGDDAALVDFLGNFILVSRYSFQPYPDDTLRQQAILAGGEIRRAYGEQPPVGPMADYLRREGYRDDGRIGRAMAGAIVGFAAPAVANVVGLVLRWFDSGEVWRLSRAIREMPPDERLGRITRAVRLGLKAAPVPPILYRTALEGKGEFVVVGLQSVFVDAEQNGYLEPWQWLFGGPHGGAGKGGRPPHGCPAGAAAVATIAGVAAAVLDRPDLQQESNFTFSFNGGVSFKA